MYCRLPRGEVPRYFDEPFRFNTARLLSKGDDLTVLSTGATTAHAIQACAALAAAGVGVTHLNVSTLKPFTDPQALESITRTSAIITVENHLTHGGLGTAVAELVAEHGLGATLRKVGIHDTFTHGGRAEYLFAHYGIDAAAIVKVANELLGLSVTLSAAPEHESRHVTLNAGVSEGL